MNKKKIAFYGIKFYPSKGGSSRIAENIAKELSDRYDITFYCYKNAVSKSHLKNVNVVEIPEIPLKEFGVFLYYFICAVHLLFSKKYDLIHVHKTDSALFIPLLRLKSKVIATSQEAPYRRDKWNLLTKAYFRMMEYFFIHGSTERTSVSKPLAQYYEKKYGRPVHYIPNGVAVDNRAYTDPIDGLLRENGIEGNEEFILFAARRIMSTKGLHTLLEAMHKIDYKGKILIAGQESHAKAYMKSIAKLAEGLDTRFLGYIDGKEVLMPLLDRAKLFIFPSLNEGLSLMLLEVGTRGTTPILCSDIPENTQVFTDNEVVYFKADDSDDFAKKFQWAIAHPKEMTERAERGRTLVNQEYTSQVVANKYAALYHQMLES